MSAVRKTYDFRKADFYFGHVHIYSLT